MAEELVAGPRRGPDGVRTELRRERRDAVMTMAVRKAFLVELRRTCNIAAAARAVGVGEDRPRQLARHNAEFGAAVRAALAEGYSTLEFRLLEMTLRSFGVDARGEPVEGDVADPSKAGSGKPIEPRTALSLLNAHRKTVLEERARTAAEAATTRAAPAQGEAVKWLRAKLDEMAERAGPERGDE